MQRLLWLVALMAASASAQAPDALRVYGPTGGAADLGDVADAMAEADVVFLGETHDDSVGHAVEAWLLAAVHERVAPERPVVLALEMAEADVQTVLDEYLAGLVRERDWLAAGRPWGNYDTDYRPLVEFARAHGVPVVATNVPGRYASLVSRRGVASLDSLSEAARAWLPPLPVAPPSAATATAFTDLMGGMAHGSGPSVEGMLAAQNLRDASMAYRIGRALERHPGALVIHVNGSFHSAGGRGIPEHLAHDAPDARVLVVTLRPAADLGAAPEVDGDGFVILTRAAE